MMKMKVMKVGRIELYDWDGILVDNLRYNSVPHRKQLIEMWRKRYQSKFNGCYFQIIPSTDTYRVRLNGENGKPKKEYFTH